MRQIDNQPIQPEPNYLFVRDIIVLTSFAIQCIESSLLYHKPNTAAIDLGLGILFMLSAKVIDSSLDSELPSATTNAERSLLHLTIYAIAIMSVATAAIRAVPSALALFR